MSLFRNNYKELVLENECRLSEISGENFKTLDNMFKYLRTFEVSLFELEMIRKDLIGLAKEAEMEGVTFLDKIGMPEKEFCDSLVKDGIKPSHLEKALPRISSLIIISFICYTTFWTLIGMPEDYSFPVSSVAWVPVFWVFIFLVIRKLERKGVEYSFSGKNRNKKRVYNFLALLSFIILCAWDLPESMDFTIPGNGKVIFFTLLILSVVSFFGNNYYWDKLSEKYNWK